jgi:hypothetical protein
MNQNGNRFKYDIKRVFPLLIALFFFTGLQELATQTMACNGTPQAPLNVSVDEVCDAWIFKDMVLEGSFPPVPHLLEVRTFPANNLVVSGLDSVNVPPNFLGQILRVTVTNTVSQNSCDAYMQISDVLAPTFLLCEDVDVECNASLHPDDIGGIDVEDNCTPVTLTYFDVSTGLDCDLLPPYIGSITRTWTATDTYNNTSNCVQTINLLPLDMDEVVYPPSLVTLSCENANISPDNTGWPMYLGMPISNDNNCLVNVGYNDVVGNNSGCPGTNYTYIITRTWTVIFECDNEAVTYNQVIVVNDNTGPTITCPPTISVLALNPFTCTGTVNLPTPTAFDNCTPSGNILITVNTSYGQTGFGPHFNVPVGAHTITYTATDECWNMTSCQSTLIVSDGAIPTAICKEFTVASLNSQGVAVVPAITLDNGSFDNCNAVTFTASQNNGATFGPFLTFDCNNAGMTVPVILKVTDAGNPNLFNTCVVNITVMNNLPPVLVCPANVTVDCDDINNDLSVYGEPTLFYNCPMGNFDNLTETVVENLSNCGVGTIVRTFTFTSASGVSANCSQTIFVQNISPFVGSNIIWPPDYEVNDQCITIDNLDPEDIPTTPINYSVPTIPQTPCALLGTNYVDQVFYVSYPACYKILRTWTVLDWCQSSGNSGVFSHIQVIKVNDYTPPVLTIPANITVGVGSNCQTGVVNVPPATATDCSPNIFFTNNSPYATSSGANVSGNYPLGTTVVTIQALDGCGNETVKQLTINVVDNTPPALACNTGVSTDLANNLGNIEAIVFANVLLVSTSDNCTPTNEIGVFIRKAVANPTGPPATTQLTYTCDDVGSNLVEVWVVDQAGNADYCVTNVIIQDNFNLCPNPTAQQATVAGAIVNEDGIPVAGSKVFFSAANMPTLTVTGSTFTFPDMPVGLNYLVHAEKDQFPMNGVSTYDLVLMMRHILGIQPLNSPYKLIAADANFSGSVSTIDMVEIRRLILGINTNFQNNLSWRFVDAAYVFPNPNNPFSPGFPEAIALNNLSGNEMNLNFVAVKIGDVNCSAVPHNFGEDHENRTVYGTLDLLASDVELQAGQTYRVPVRATNFDQIIGFQFTLEFNPGVLQLRDIHSADLPELGTEQFGMHLLDQGLLTSSWFAAEAVNLSEGEVLFELEFEALRSARLSEQLSISSAITRAEAYWPRGEELELRLEFIRPELTQTAPGMRVQQNRPNPFALQTVIGFELDEAAPVILSIFDLSGRLLLRREQPYVAGQHEIDVDRSMLAGPGMYFYQIETPFGIQTRRMVLTN